MANTMMQDPRSTQARSAWIAGLTEACNKITSVLNMETASFEDMPLIEDRPTEDDVRRIYISQLGNKLWLNVPSPVIKLNGNEITTEGYDYTIDYLGGSIVFEGEFRPAEGDRITASATYIKGGSSTIDGIISKITELDNKSAKNYKGYFESANDIESADITGEKGDYVIVESTNDIYVWNAKTGKFEPTYKIPDLSGYYTKTETDNLLSMKQDGIVAHGSTNASDAYYYGGRKTWVDLYSMVLNTAIKGIVFTDDSTLLQTDSILTALGKLQAQITRRLHPIIGNGSPTATTKGIVGQDYINSSNGDKYHLVSIGGDGSYVWEKYANVSGVMTVTGGGIAKLTGDFGNAPYEFEFTPDTETKVNSFNGRTGNVTSQKSDYTASQIDFVAGNTGMKSTDVDGAIKELFTSGSEGKALIASAITSKGVETSADASFATMSENIKKISAIPFMSNPAKNHEIWYGKQFINNDGEIDVGTLNWNNVTFINDTGLIVNIFGFCNNGNNIDIVSYLNPNEQKTVKMYAQYASFVYTGGKEEIKNKGTISCKMKNNDISLVKHDYTELSGKVQYPIAVARIGTGTGTNDTITIY